MSAGATDRHEPIAQMIAMDAIQAAFQRRGQDSYGESVCLLGHSLQCGPMSPAQAAAFEAEPFFAGAVRLRRWDEEAKIVGHTGPPLVHFERLVVASLAASA